VFLLAALILKRLDPVRHLPAFQALLQSGMLVHIAMAALMMIWGWILLRRRRLETAKTRGWLILVSPCPVCATVILLSLALLRALLPDHFPWLVLGLYAAFMLLGLLTAWIVGLYQEARGQPSEPLLGAAMMLIAAWFLISATVIPQFADLDKVYRLAGYRSGTQVKQAFSWVWMAMSVAAAFTLGYGLTYLKTRKRS
jgi:predicted transporter